MGPNTSDKKVMMELARNGMDVARFNFPMGLPTGIRDAPGSVKGSPQGVGYSVRSAPWIPRDRRSVPDSLRTAKGTG